MTRAEAKAAMDAGKKIGYGDGDYSYYDPLHHAGPYIYVGYDSIPERMNEAWDWMDTAYILHERKTRPCTQLEILAIQTKPNRVVREKGTYIIVPSSSIIIPLVDSPYYEWAEFNPDDNLGPWHDFVVEEEV